MGVKIEFIADSVKFTGPMVDGGGKITFDIGEFMIGRAIELLKIPQQTTLKITVETDK